MAIAAFSCEFHYFMGEIVPKFIGENHYRAFPEKFLKEIREY